jgi:hypothetical protein
MAQTSPSEFLTFYRTIRTASTLKPAVLRCLVPRPQRRPYSSKTQKPLDDYKELGPDKDHNLDKAAKGDPNIQTREANQGAK